MLPRVKEAMEVVARNFVNMDELMTGVGDRLGELTGAEYGIVTSGAAAALCHATAACVAGGDPERMLQLPRTDGLSADDVHPDELGFADIAGGIIDNLPHLRERIKDGK